MLFSPNAICYIIKTVSFNKYGEPERYDRVEEKCALLEAGITLKKSSVRADSSASRGNAIEKVADYWLILMPDTCAEINDLIEIHGVQVKIVQMTPRYSLRGELDHFEALCARWTEVEE